MSIKELLGQELIIKALRRARQRAEVSHAYLFSGPVGSGKKTLATFFAQSLNCSSVEAPPCGQCLSCRKIAGGHHPDLYRVEPAGASIKIEQLREIRDRLYYFPREGRKKVCIIQEAELLTLPAANSLLKILEEPPGELVFLLLSARPWALPGTVLSRCIQFNLRPLAPQQMTLLLQRERPALSSGEREFIMALARGNPGKGLEMASRGGWEEKFVEAWTLLDNIENGPVEDLWLRAEEIAKREDLLALLDLFALIYRERLLAQLGFAAETGIIKERLGFNNKNKEVFSAGPAFLEKICRFLLQLQGELMQNVNKRLALEVFFLQMRGAV